MYKLVILIEQLEDISQFDEMWPEFLHISEQMPGLRKEATCRVESNLFGTHHPIMMHEIFFNTLDDLYQAMSSPEGRKAGELLQIMTNGRMTLFTADHKEDDIDNIRLYRQNEGDEQGTTT